MMKIYLYEDENEYYMEIFCVFFLLTYSYFLKTSNFRPERIEAIAERHLFEYTNIYI